MANKKKKKPHPLNIFALIERLRKKKKLQQKDLKAIEDAQ